MIRIGITGASGYSGLELIKLLHSHPQVKIDKLFGQSTVGKNISDIHPSLRNIFSAVIENFDEKKLNSLDCLFIALPSGESFPIAEIAAKKNIITIDLGGDYRLNDMKVYEQYYKKSHKLPELMNKSVYGLPEWNEENISGATFIANPGCYPTSILLGLIPLLKYNFIKTDSIAINSYSGISGAGKSVSESMMFAEINENTRAYKIGTHQHIPEIKLYLEKFSNKNSDFSFVPHLLPITRGIYTTMHAKLTADYSEEQIHELYMHNYANKKFIRVLGGSLPELKNVQHTNFCDIGFKVYDNNLIIITAIDNLIKGASGQAIQNMNIIFNFSQATGLL